MPEGSDITTEDPSQITPDIDWQLNVLGRATSTQDIVKLAAQDGDPEGYVVQAMMQASGQGRHGNKWESPMGNIYMSILLRPTCGVERAGELAFVVAVALSKAFDVYIDASKHKKTLKWPNDILIDDRKISGILLESNMKGGELDGLVIGMGVNILKAPEGAVSLEEVASGQVFINKVRDTILLELDKAYALWKKDGFAPIREAWLSDAHGIGGAMTARLPNTSHKGIFSGLTENGSLILTQEDGEEKIITAGDVHFGDVE